MSGTTNNDIKSLHAIWLTPTPTNWDKYEKALDLVGMVGIVSLIPAALRVINVLSSPLGKTQVEKNWAYKQITIAATELFSIKFALITIFGCDLLSPLADAAAPRENPQTDDSVAPPPAPAAAAAAPIVASNTSAAAAEPTPAADAAPPAAPAAAAAPVAASATAAAAAEPTPAADAAPPAAPAAAAAPVATSAAASATAAAAETAAPPAGSTAPSDAPTKAQFMENYSLKGKTVPHPEKQGNVRTVEEELGLLTAESASNTATYLLTVKNTMERRKTELAKKTDVLARIHFVASSQDIVTVKGTWLKTYALRPLEHMKGLLNNGEVGKKYCEGLTKDLEEAEKAGGKDALAVALPGFLAALKEDGFTIDDSTLTVIVMGTNLPVGKNRGRALWDYLLEKAPKK